jgi:betaine-aldehyde dehydrogenase
MPQILSDKVEVEKPSLPGNALNWTGGAWIDAKQRTKSFDPATGDEIVSYADASRDDMQSAIDIAVRAFQTTDWRENRRLRSKVVNQIAGRFEARRGELIGIPSFENGKVRAEAAFEVDMIARKFRYSAAFVLTDYGRGLEIEPRHPFPPGPRR